MSKEKTWQGGWWCSDCGQSGREQTTVGLAELNIAALAAHKARSPACRAPFVQITYGP